MIRLALVSVLLSMGLSAAPQRSDATSTSKAATPAKKAGMETDSLPADAQLQKPGLWKHVDADGKTWLIKKTPFGYARTPERENSEMSPAKRLPAFTVVSVEGEKVTFESTTPFGKRRWTREKPELNDNETAALQAYEKTAEK